MRANLAPPTQKRPAENPRRLSPNKSPAIVHRAVQKPTEERIPPGWAVFSNGTVGVMLRS